MKAARIILLLCLAAAASAGCASLKLKSALASPDYAGQWFAVDTTATNIPSGAHLLNLVVKASAANAWMHDGDIQWNSGDYVREIISKYGMPDYIRADLPHELWPGDNWVSFIFVTRDLYFAVDLSNGVTTQDRVEPYNDEGEWMSGMPDNALPPQYVTWRQKKKADEERVKAAEVHRRNEARNREARRQREAEEKARIEAAAMRSREQAAAAEVAKAFDINLLKQRADARKGETIVFKNFYVGMPVSDCLSLINHHMGLRQVSSIPIEDMSAMSDAKEGADPEKAYAAAMMQALGSQVQGMTRAQLRAQGLDEETIEMIGVTDATASYRVYTRKGRMFIAKSPREKPFAVAEPDGTIVSLQLGPQILDKLFDSAGMPTSTFLQSFVDAYHLAGFDAERQKISATILGTTKEIGFQNIYRHRDPKGFEVIYYADSVIFDEGAETFADTPPKGTMTIKKIETANELKSKFD